MMGTIGGYIVYVKYSGAFKKILSKQHIYYTEFSCN
jgi:hypothetical protein